ncbi:Similar to TAF3: Transcription initiation factor TFIID subunit 3 (Homo sapiens) [Cotesia congregata]|uniref:Similar to TAF3: Transcription initiation factor TFIID subunit 3 (Homo sapiens) n=1 Tax=Cotesia congregata TaxID=51543 RepID=A0A8J2HHH8_COTCN|nr:Similar to TAF3: Transcription initiation factor TFIID subunit 3 (Homo sapiens) [Cotesia congregata]
MVDLLDEYLRQMGQISHNYAEVLGRTDIDLQDVSLIFQNMNADLDQLAEYVKNAGSVPCVIQVSKYPIPRKDHFNFMDPEIRKRPMYSNFNELSDEEKEIFKAENININNNQRDVIKRPGNRLFGGLASGKRSKLSSSELMRKVHSVVMTTSGFLAPVCEGKLPESWTSVENHREFYEEPEISIIDEYKNENLKLPVRESTNLIINTEIPKIKISKVESLANLPQEREKWSVNSVNTPNLSPENQLSLKNKQITDKNDELKKFKEKNKKHRKDKKKAKEDDIIIVYPLDTPVSQSLEKKSIKDKNIKISSNLYSPILPSGVKLEKIEEKKKCKADTKINSAKSSEDLVEKVTLEFPEEIDDAESDLVILPSLVVKRKVKQKKILKNVKKRRKQVEKVLTVVAPKYGTDGKRIWICPPCGREDDGTPMIGCDDCNDWFHWVCIGMRVPPPDEANWYCKPCLAKKRKEGTGGSKKKSQGVIL